MIHIVPEGEHSALGPSSAERWINCPGSVRASQRYPSAGSVYAAEGSAAHYLADLSFREGIWLVGDTVKVGQYSFTVTPEWVRHINGFNEWCEEMPGDQFSEVRLNYGNWIPEGFGTADRISLDDGTCYVRDLKFGQGVQVFAKENEQLKVYALGALNEYAYLYDIDHFEVGIDQPRLNHRDIWDISRKDLEQWGNDVLRPAFKRVEAGTEFKAGNWCQFCRFKNDCAVRMNQGLAAVLADFEDLDALDDARGTKELKLLTSEQKAKIYPDVKVLKDWIADFESSLVADLMRGVKFATAKLVMGRSNRQWNAPSVSIQIAEAGVEPYEKKLRSPADVEKEMGKKHFNECLGGLVVKPPGRPTLVGVDDPRPPMDITPEFTNLDEEDANGW